MARYGAVGKLNAHKPAPQPLRLHCGKCVSAYESSRLVKFDKEGQPSFQRGDVVGEFVAVQRQSYLETESVATAETAWRNFAACHEGVPDFDNYVGAGVYFKSVLAGVAGTAYKESAAVGQCCFLECVEGEVGAVYAEHVFHYILGERSLYGKFGEFVAQIVYLYIESFSTFVHPPDVLVDIGGVYNEQKVVFAAPVHQQVVDCAAVRVQHHAVENLAVRSSGNVVCEYVVHKFFGIGTGHKHFAHVAHIEYTAGVAHGVVFLRYSGVLYRHVESCKRSHLRAESHMARVKAGLFYRFHVYLYYKVYKPVIVYPGYDIMNISVFQRREDCLAGVAHALQAVEQPGVEVGEHEEVA